MSRFGRTIRSPAPARYACASPHGEFPWQGAGTSVTASEFWPLFAAPLLNGIALLLALGFRRNRAVIMLAVLAFSSLLLADVAPDQNARGQEAVRMFAPWLLLAAAAMPERRLLARRNLILLLLLAIAIWLTLAAPERFWPW